jgi:hypothetical protein
MVCELIIKQMERKLKRKLTPQEKKKVEEMAHHSKAEHKSYEEIQAGACA